MSESTYAPAPQKAVYQRPYKSRRQRRERDRRQHDENSDYQFLRRAGGVVGLLLIIALVFAVKGMMDSGGSPA